MKVNISDIARYNGASISLHFEVAPSEVEIDEGFLLDRGLSFDGTVTNTNGIMRLAGNLKAIYRNECYRCLGVVSKALELNIEESFINSPDAEQMDMYPFEGKILDINKALNDNIILSLPMKQLCSEECKGLCNKCGANLNEMQCGCSEYDIDLRLEGLNKYLENL